MDFSKPWAGAVPIDSIVANPGQPRTYFDEEALARTAASCGRRQIQALLVIPHQDKARPSVRWMIVDGERRWRGLKGIGAKTCKVIFDPEITAETIFADSVAANFCRAGHTHAERARAVEGLRQDGKTYEEIGAIMGKTGVTVANDHKLLGLAPRLLAMMDPPTDKSKRLAMRVAIILADLPHAKQLEQWERLKKHDAATQFHKLRHTSSGPVGLGFTPADNARYTLGKVRAAYRHAEAFVYVPLPMLKKLPAEAFEEIREEFRRLEAAIEKGRERLDEAERSGER